MFCCHVPRKPGSALAGLVPNCMEFRRLVALRALSRALSCSLSPAASLSLTSASASSDMSACCRKTPGPKAFELAVPKSLISPSSGEVFSPPLSISGGIEKSEDVPDRTAESQSKWQFYYFNTLHRITSSLAWIFFPEFLVVGIMHEDVPCDTR